MDDRTDQEITNELLQAILNELKKQSRYIKERDYALLNAAEILNTWNENPYSKFIKAEIKKED